MYRAENNRWTWSKYGGALPGQVNSDALVAGHPHGHWILLNAFLDSSSGALPRQHPRPRRPPRHSRLPRQHHHGACVPHP